MKRIFGMLLAITLVTLVVSALYAEEFTDESGKKCFVYCGRVVKLATEIVTPKEDIPFGNTKTTEIEGEAATIYLPTSYTITHFTVLKDDSNEEESNMEEEHIENGNGKDMSAVIAVVSEAFTSGAVIAVVKCYESVPEIYYDELERLKEESQQLPYEYFQRIKELSKRFYSLPEVVKVIAAYRNGEITLEEYWKLIRELRVSTGYNDRLKKLQVWYKERKLSLRDEIASLEKKIEDILNSPPKLRSVSIKRGDKKLRYQNQ